ncbi:SMP-30/gluconolactonase/LRE family protein [Saccharothrix variisporea]|uniref:Sugar lactone lactonase YvrE n=1 Tax=Saccharothrix variisporea TaxID=543527 RepID=A0A495XIB9_9PSEU|nr:SMP-30/gluconolactonase/LRE family protein [Saccharothrix variisporea]RKT71348.1 sugar lactone lactonase YvrE [Saccharothrix variisporea]
MRFLIALVAALLLVAAPAQASPSPHVVSGHSAQLHPEGITWDPVRRAFLVSSLRHGTVEVVRPDGTTRTLVRDPRMVSTFGIHAVGTKLYVTFGDIGLSARSTPDTTGKSSGLAVYDLVTGRLLHFVDLAIGEGGHSANDVAVDRRGNAYVTDPSSDAIYRVDPHGRATVLHRDPRFASASIGLNGIVWHPAGFLIAGRYDTGTLFKIPVDNPSAFTEITTDQNLAGADGLDLRPDGTLAVVTNALGAPGTNAVTVLRSHDNWQTARTTRRTAPWGDDEPTTITHSPHGSYAVDGNIGALLAGTTSDAFTLREL